MFQIGGADPATKYDIEFLHRDLKDLEQRMTIKLGAMGGWL
jgi:hypothetical protein